MVLVRKKNLHAPSLARSSLRSDCTKFGKDCERKAAGLCRFSRGFIPYFMRGQVCLKCWGANIVCRGFASQFA